MAEVGRTPPKRKAALQMAIYQKILDNVEEEIMLLDTDFRIIWANKRVLQKYAGDKASVVSDFCYEVTHRIDHVCRPPHDVCPMEETLRTGRPASVLHTHVDKGGNKIYVEVSGYPLYEHGKITEFIHISRDVTARVRNEERLKEQQQSLLELSTPVIKVWEGVIALPLVGVIDSHRARQIMENLLEAIVQTQAGIAIIDITGVPLVDTEVADRLIKTMKAAGLLGTKCIMVGIRPDIAQSMVHLGVDLSGVETFSTLQAGLEAAYSRIGVKVVKQ